MALPHQTITQIPDSDPAPDAEPSLWNSRYDEIDANFASVQGDIDTINAEINDLTDRIGVVEVEGPLAITKAVKSDWHYRTNKTAMELWTPYWTLIDMVDKLVVQAISGDDSIDIDSTSGLLVGSEYVIKDSVNSEVIKVSQILTSHRFIADSVLQNSYTTGATVSKTSFSVNQALSKAVIEEGNIYLCGPLMLGGEDMKSCIVHRNETANVSLYFKDSSHSEWTLINVAWTRTSDVDGTIEDEYLFPADGGDIHIKCICDEVAESPDSEIYGIIFLSEYSGIGGWHTPPDQPVNSIPVDESGDVEEEAVFAVSGYSSIVGSPQSAIQFQVVLATPEIEVDPDDTTEDEGWEPQNIKWDSGPIVGTDLSAKIDAGILSDAVTAYKWRARVEDSYGYWSDWSEPTSFTTRASFDTPGIVAPTLTSPTNASTVTTLTPTFTTSAFSVSNSGSDTHLKTQWQMRLSSGSYDDPVFDVESTSSKTSYAVTSLGLLTIGQRYYWRARHCGTTYGYSEWSSESYFNAPESVPAPTYAFSSIKSYSSGYMKDMKYDQDNDVLYISGIGEGASDVVVHRLSDGSWSDAVISDAGGHSTYGYPMILSTNGITVALFDDIIAYSSKSGFDFSLKTIAGISLGSGVHIKWQSSVFTGPVSRFFGISTDYFDDALKIGSKIVRSIMSVDDFTSTYVENWDTSAFNLLVPRSYGKATYLEVLGATKLASGREIVALSVCWSTKSAAVVDWQSKSLVGFVPSGIDEIFTICDAGSYGLFIGTSNGMIFKSTDGGATLTAVAINLDTAVKNIIQVNNELLLASTYPNGRLYSSHDGGKTWSRVTGWTYGNISCMATKTTSVVYAATMPANLLYETNPSSVYTITITR